MTAKHVASEHGARRVAEEGHVERRVEFIDARLAEGKLPIASSP